MNDLPIPKEPNVEANEEIQKKLRFSPPPTSRAFGVISETERIPPHLLTSFQLEDYAEALCDVGRWEDAVKLNTLKKAFYEQVIDAIYLDDSYSCDCPEFNGIAKVANEKGVIEQKQSRFSNWFVLREVFSPVHGQARLMKCNKCGDLNCVK